MAIYIGIDLGTSGCRAIAIDENAVVRAKVSTSVPLPLRKANHIEQEPEVWWQATQRVLKDISNQINPSDVKAIAVDGTSGTLVLCDKQGRPLQPAIMYNDARAAEQATRIKQYALKRSAAQGPASALAKLLWYQDRQITQRAAFALHQTDWVSAQLCGRFGISDINNALKLGYDPVAMEWPEWLDKVKTPRHLLPRVVKAGSIMGTIRFELTERFNFPITTQIIAGTTDSTASFLATGASQAGEAVTSLGSTLVLKVLAKEPVFDPRYGVYSQPINGQWLVGGASNTGGAVLLKYFTQEQLDEMTSQLKPAVSTDLEYYPLFSDGERFPINDPKLKSKTLPRPPDDVEFFQGLLEGIASIEQQGYERLAELGAPFPTKIYTTGGGARNEAWTMIRSLMLGIPITVSGHTEAAYGSALLARKGSINVTANLKSFL
ncbi:MAG: FGGY-family carbohydrate kinase [Gammaproteobacteria bacterium]|nr:FGGY-family carbohydrate kinase [Gammaproteobacteria bacterium]